MEVSTPGRICLFGEHQDYLGLPVIALAVSLRAKIIGEKRLDQKVIIHMPDIERTERFDLNDTEYQKERDYFKSGIRVCRKEGLSFASGFECEINSDIPIKAGTSSSSAIIVSWINFLNQMADDPMKLTNEKIGELSFKAEVTEFSGPGGMMDQYTTAMGNLVYLESEPCISVNKFNAPLEDFVLGDSREPKDTFGILSRCKNSRLEILKKIKPLNVGFSLQSCDFDLDLSVLSEDEKTLFNSTLKNRNILREAKLELNKKELDHERIGFLLNQHHSILRDHLNISTPKIEAMIDSAKEAGAVGCKINGSGGGGCMFAYAPKNASTVADAIESVGGKAFLINADEGTKIVTS
jgi:galactokinase